MSLNKSSRNHPEEEEKKSENNSSPIQNDSKINYLLHDPEGNNSSSILPSSSQEG